MEYKNILEIDVGRCINTLLLKWKYICIITLLFFLAGLGLTLDKGVDQYTATATAYAAAEGSYSDSSTAVTAMNAYLNVAISYKVCQRAALIIGRSEISPYYIQNAMRISSSANRTSSSSSSYILSSATILSFAATTPDPELSKAMADAMAQSYAIEMAGILDNNSVKVLDNAYYASKSYDAVRSAWKLRIIAAAVGFLSACGFIIAFEIFDTKVRTVREASVRNNIPVLGIIPDFNDKGDE
jgi:capsular polysaccharide biosynthesis protein